jgi:hypothetical protein
MYKTDLVLYADKYLDMVPFVNHNAITPAVETKSIFRINNNYFFILEQVQGGNPSNFTSKIVNESEEVLASSYGSAVNNWVYNLTIACNRSEGIYLSTGTGNPQYSGWAAWLTKISEDGFYEFARGSNGSSSVTTGMQCDDCKRTRLGMYSGENTIGYITGETDDSQVVNTLWDKPVPKELPYTARGLTAAPYQCCGGNKEIIAFYLDADDQYIWNNSATNIAKLEIWCRGDFLTRVSKDGFQCCDRFIISKKENETNLYEIWTYSENEPKHWEFTFLNSPSIANCCNGIMRLNAQTADGDRCMFFGYEGIFAESDAKDCNDFTILCCGVKRAIAVNANISFVVDDTFGLIPIDMYNLKVLDSVHKTDFTNYNETRIKKLTREDIE